MGNCLITIVKPVVKYLYFSTKLAWSETWVEYVQRTSKYYLRYAGVIHQMEMKAI